MGGEEAYGVGYIEASQADEVDEFYREYMNPYVNYHRPSAVAEKVMDEKKKGKEKRVYRWWATPYEILRQLPDLARYLKEDVTMEQLEREAGAKSDMESATQMQAAKEKLFDRIWKKQSA